MRLGVSLFEFILLGVHWTSWTFIFMYVIKFGKFSDFVFSDTFFFSFLSFHFSFSTPALDYVCPLHGVPQDPWVLFTFLQFFLFLFLRLNTFLCPIFKFADSFLLPAQICHSVPLVIFFSFTYCTLQHFFLGFLSLCWYFHLLIHCCFTFFTSLFSSLSFFKTVTVKFLSSVCAVRSFAGTVSVDCFFFPLWMGHTFLFFVCLVFFFFLLNTGHLNLIWWL